MGLSFKLGQVAGIPVKVHATFVLILGLGAFQWGLSHGARGAVFGALLTMAVFGCVTLHELGHALAAKVFGLGTREIVLFPLGGVAVLEQQPQRPLHELIIAVAGPLVNLLLIFGLGLTAAAALVSQGLDPRRLTPEGLQDPSFANGLIWLLAANLAMVLFNLIPAFPLDGGRVLRAVLAMLMPSERATRIATGVGQWLAIGIAIFGIVSLNLVLVLIAVFIYMGASQEKFSVQAGKVLATLRAGEAYNRHALTLSHGDRISSVVEYMLSSNQSDFAVLHAGRLIGIVTREDVTQALGTSSAEAYVAGIMRREIVRIEASASLEEARQLLALRGSRIAAVYNDDAYLGLISLEDIAEVYSLRVAQKVGARG